MSKKETSMETSREESDAQAEVIAVVVAGSQVTVVVIIVIDMAVIVVSHRRAPYRDRGRANTSRRARGGGWGGERGVRVKVPWGG